MERLEEDTDMETAEKTRQSMNPGSGPTNDTAPTNSIGRTAGAMAAAARAQIDRIKSANSEQFNRSVTQQSGE